MRYDSLLEFKLLHAKTFDWRSLSQDPMYAEIYGKLARELSLTKRKSQSKGNEEDLYAFICEEEVTISATTIGQMLDIEYSQGESRPPRDFDYDAAWRFISGRNEDLPLL
ncbi:histone-lysine N-methyltransferase ATX3-like protein [Corchorus olitorius]|uniref:Histone-lysine N-methyltransferase ATX3-like protein n=1 Tax=Corchorus olitorius TaxID=93759 RepID=A0A1R3KUZ1_9ROSI|nr:histone-lysine N-methyltransferase ATX3-like protein [Corchorus olitorius]